MRALVDAAPDGAPKPLFTQVHEQCAETIEGLREQGADVSLLSTETLADTRAFGIPDYDTDEENDCVDPLTGLLYANGVPINPRVWAANGLTFPGQDEDADGANGPNPLVIPTESTPGKAELFPGLINPLLGSLDGSGVPDKMETGPLHYDTGDMQALTPNGPLDDMGLDGPAPEMDGPVADFLKGMGLL